MSVGNVSTKPPALGAHPQPVTTAHTTTPAAKGSFHAVMTKERAAGKHAPPLPCGTARPELPPAFTATSAPARMSAAPVHHETRSLERGRQHHGFHGDAEESPVDENIRRAQLSASAALDAPPPAPQPAAMAPSEAQRAALSTILPQLVSHIAWSKENPRKGAVRMEFGGGVLAGGSMLVHCDGGRVTVRLELPAGENHDEWRSRIHQALERRGLHAGDVEVV